MKKTEKIVLAFIIIGLIALVVDNWPRYYKSNDDDQFNIGIGEHVSVAYSDNPTTGYALIWSNEKECASVVKRYQKFFQLGFKGASGIKVISFTGQKMGTDTIKITECAFDMDSSACKSSFIEHRFVVNVSE